MPAIVAWAALVLLAGCEVLHRPPAATGAHPGVAAGATFPELLRYAQWLRSQPPDALDAARDETQRSVRQSGSAADRIRLALVLSQPAAPFRDEAAARALLDEAIRQSAGEDAALHAFAVMQTINLNDREWARSGLQDRLRTERERREELERKLEELKDIEQQLHRRDQLDAGTMR